MSNKRKIIRQAFIDFLMDDTPALDRVYSSRIRPISEDDLPCINVRCDSESADVFTVAARTYKRSLDVIIEVSCKAKASVDDDMDDLLRGIELMIDSEDRFAPLDEHVHEIFYQGSGVVFEGGDKTQLTAVGTLRYRVEYFTDAGALATNADEYLQIFADFNDGQITTELDIDQ